MSQEEIEDTLRTRPEEGKQPGVSKNTRHQSIAELWMLDRRLDRFLAVLQTAFIVPYSLWWTSDSQTAFSFFVLAAFICFVSVPIIYFAKLTKGIALNRKLGALAQEKKIPSWIPFRRTLLLAIWFGFLNPLFWIFFMVLVGGISQELSFLFLVISLVPWMALEYIHRKERDYLQLFIAEDQAR